MKTSRGVYLEDRWVDYAFLTHSQYFRIVDCFSDSSTRGRQFPTLPYVKSGTVCNLTVIRDWGHHQHRQNRQSGQSRQRGQRDTSVHSSWHDYNILIRNRRFT